MAKLTKQASVLEDLRKMAVEFSKEANVQSSITGVAGADTKITSVSESNDKTDKNAVGADKLEQKYEQHASSDSSAPVKSASAVENLGNELLKEIKKVAEGEGSGTGQAAITGTPGSVTKVESVSEKNDTVNKDAVGADKLEQKVEQKPSTDAAAPVQKAAAEVELSKIAQEELGRQLAAGLIASLAQQKEKVAAEKKAELEKEAGRRDFELIATAAVDELFKEKVASEVAIVENKHAEELGKLACDIYVKDQIIAAQKEELGKYATWFENIQQEVLKKEAAEKELQKQAAFEAFIEKALEQKIAKVLSTPAK